MLIDVHMLDTETGERAVFRDGYDYEDGEFTAVEGIEFQWGENNYACDCNRGNFFARALGRADMDLPCGDGRIRVEKIVERGTETVMYADD